MKTRLPLALLALAALVVATTLCAEPAKFTKDAMLRDIVHKVILAGYEELDSKCRDLTNSIEQLVKTPDRASVEGARQSWRAAAQAAGRMQCFQKGPIADRDCVSDFYYWQVLPVRLEAVVQSAQPINQSLLEELGATTKGIFGLEYLLFGPVNGPATNHAALELAGRDGERRRAFVQALAKELQTKAAQLAADWKATDGESATARFVNVGQESVNVLVNQLAQLIENAAERRLHFVLRLPHPVSAQLDRIERTRSGSSLEGILASLEGARALYGGGDGLGLDDAVKRVNAPLGQRLGEQFDAAITAVRAISGPLERAVTEDRASVQNAYEQTRALEILFKVDLASTLGVTLTFSSADGD